MDIVWARFEQRERKYAPDKDFSYNSAMKYIIWPWQLVQGYETPVIYKQCLSGVYVWSKKG